MTYADYRGETAPSFHIARYGRTRFWAVMFGAELVAVVVYKRGATEIVRRLTATAKEE